MAPQWEDKLNQAHSNAQLPKLQKTWEQAISSLRTPPEARLQLQPALALPLGAVPGKVTVINGATPAEISNLLAQATKAAQQSRIQNQVLVTQLDKLPFTVATVADALRHIGIPETRIRQLLLQVGLQSAENVNPTSLSPAQMRTLALVAALHGSEPTIIVARPFDGVEPHVARTLSDFLVVSALERQKAFVLINPGTTVEGWRGSDWANWHEIAPLSAPIQAIVGKPFGGMDLNIPQELLELQMARKALLSTKDTIDRSEAEDESETGVEFLEEKLARQDPFQDKYKDLKDRVRKLSQGTQQLGRAGFFMLPKTKREKVSIPAHLDYFSGSKPSRLRSMLIITSILLIVSAVITYFLQN